MELKQIYSCIKLYGHAFCMYVCLLACLSFCLSVCLFVCLFVFLFFDVIQFWGAMCMLCDVVAEMMCPIQQFP